MSISLPSISVFCLLHTTVWTVFDLCSQATSLKSLKHECCNFCLESEFEHSHSSLRVQGRDMPGATPHSSSFGFIGALEPAGSNQQGTQMG